jgi:hypothetical protein
MPLQKHAYPILEYDTEKTAVIQPNRNGKPTIPSKCLMTFFEEALDDFAKKSGAAKVNTFDSEMREFPIYKAEYKGQEIGLIQATVGSGSIAMMTDFLKFQN